MRWKGICSYDGGEFAGWQSQITHNGVQDFLEERLYKIFKRSIRLHGSSRTDAGVHAEKQVFHFDAAWTHGSQALLRAFNTGLPHALRVETMESITKDFHARFSAKRKRYRYELLLDWPSPFEWRYCWGLGPQKTFDCAAMARVARHFIGCHNFSSFAGKVLKSENPIKTILLSEIAVKGKRIFFSTEGSGYLYRMVRVMVGCLVAVAQGKVSEKTILSMLSTSQRLVTFSAAPAQGLYLETVIY